MEKIFSLDTYDYNLDKNLIAQYPVKKRDESNLLILDKKNGNIIHEKFFNIYKFINKNDLLIFNNTKVIPARIFGNKKGTNAKIEVLLVNNVKENTWEVMMKNLRRLKTNDIVIFDKDLSLKIIEKKGKIVLVEFNKNYNDLIKTLWDIGHVPLPPYIKRKDTEEDKKTYQTIFAKYEGAKAAPTAGFHFTSDLIKKLKNKGVNFAEITLHVGLGTFEPILEKDIRNHKMHKEYFEVSKETIKQIEKTKKNNGKIIAVGTTVLRTLESIYSNNLKSLSGWTDLFIYPGYKFKIVDNLITNFHLPKTTLFILVCAFAGIDNIKRAYNEAIKNKYRFFSYGDAMFIK